MSGYRLFQSLGPSPQCLVLALGTSSRSWFNLLNALSHKHSGVQTRTWGLWNQTVFKSTQYKLETNATKKDWDDALTSGWSQEIITYNIIVFLFQDFLFSPQCESILIHDADLHFYTFATFNSICSVDSWLLQKHFPLCAQITVSQQLKFNSGNFLWFKTKDITAETLNYYSKLRFLK